MEITKKNIYIPIEIYYREFIPRLYFASKALKKKYRVYIGTKHGIDKILEKKYLLSSYGGIYFNKGILIANKDYLNKIDNICDNFIVLDEELGPSIPAKKTAIVNRCVFEKKVKKFFTIGKAWKNKIIQHNKKFKPIIVSTGWPRYDLLNDKKINFYLKKANELRKKYGKFHLFSSNYGTLSHEGLSERLRIIKKDHTSKFCQKKKKIFKRNIKDFKEFIEDLSLYYSNNGKKKIIIRPHPSEFYHEDWIRNTKHLSKNISVIYKDDIIPWIMASEGLIHRGCGTSIDAYILKKKVYFLHPKRKLSSDEKNLTFKVSNIINSLLDIDKKFNHTDLRHKYLKNEIENYDKNNSSEKILKEIDKLKTNKEHPIKPDNKLLLIYFFLKNLLKSLLIKNKNNKMPYKIKVGDIKHFFNNLKNMKNVKIRKINSEAIELDNF